MKAPLIDPRVRYVGLTTIRRMNTARLHALDEELLVIQDREQPVAVLMSYKLFMRMNELLKEATR